MTMPTTGRRTQMVNITHKQDSLRKAVASAVVKVSSPATIEAIVNRKVPKGDVFEFARAAGLLAIKKTSDVIPDCHPLPVEYAAITYSVEDLEVRIQVEVHTIYKTGVEVEAMHGAGIVALVMYDMLKPIDKSVEISTIKLVSKKGGRTDLKLSYQGLKCAVVVCSDSVSKGEKEDLSGRKIVERLSQFQIETDDYRIVPDDIDAIRNTLEEYLADKFDLVVFAGGTGVSPRDNTPAAIAPLIEMEIPGISETARRYGQQRMPYAMLSRSVSGFIKNTLVLTFPGSVRGVEETMDALFPQVLHVFSVRAGGGH